MLKIRGNIATQMTPGSEYMGWQVDHNLVAALVMMVTGETFGLEAAVSLLFLGITARVLYPLSWGLLMLHW